MLHQILPIYFRLNSGQNQALACVWRDGDAEPCCCGLLYHKKSARPSFWLKNSHWRVKLYRPIHEKNINTVELPISAIILFMTLLLTENL
jgi:hypothetical protein